jgi:hypothetical protein
MDRPCRAHGGRLKIRAQFWLAILKEGDHSEDLGGDGRIILKWILLKNDLGCGLDLGLHDSEQGPLAGPCEHCNEPSVP